MHQSAAQVPSLGLVDSTNLYVHHDPSIGCLKATGEDTLDLINRLSTNKIDHLQPGHWAPTILTSDRGRIVDLLSVIHADDCVYLLTSPGQQQTVIDWLDKYTIMEDLEVEDVSASTAFIAVVGKGAEVAAGHEPDPTERLPGIQYPAPVVSVGGRETLAIRIPLGDLPACLLVASSESAPDILAALAASGALELDAGTWEAPPGCQRRACVRQRDGRALQPAGGGPHRGHRLYQGLLHRPGGHRPPRQLRARPEIPRGPPAFSDASDAAPRHAPLPRGQAGRHRNLGLPHSRAASCEGWASSAPHLPLPARRWNCNHQPRALPQ